MVIGDSSDTMQLCLGRFWSPTYDPFCVVICIPCYYQGLIYSHTEQVLNDADWLIGRLKCETSSTSLEEIFGNFEFHCIRYSICRNFLYLFMYVQMYFCVCVCVCVCAYRWCKQPSTGHPGRGAVLLTVRTANELCSILPRTGAVSRVSWTCNRGTTEGERERFLLFNPTPKEWNHSLSPASTHPQMGSVGASYWQCYLFCLADCDKGVHCDWKPDKIREFIPSPIFGT